MPTPSGANRAGPGRPRRTAATTSCWSRRHRVIGHVVCGGVSASYPLAHPSHCLGPAIAHVGPLIRAWAALPRHGIAGLRAIVRVSARNSGFACEQHARPGAVVSVSQTTSPTTPHCWRLSPRWSALWAPRRPEPRPDRPKPRPHRQQTGGIAPIEARHAGDTPWRGF